MSKEYRLTLSCLLFLTLFVSLYADNAFQTRYQSNGSSVWYRAQSGEYCCMSEAMGGYHMAPRWLNDQNHNWVVWEIWDGERIGIGLCDLETRQSRAHFFKGVQDIGQIEAVFSGSLPLDLFFIAKRERVDLFHFNSLAGVLTSMTRDEAVEQAFSLKVNEGRVTVIIERNDARHTVRFDLEAQFPIPLEKGERSLQPKPWREAAPRTGGVSQLDDCYVVLGDSITAGKMYLPNLGDTAGVNRPQFAFPARLAEQLKLEGYAIEFVNAGENGSTTARGLERLDAVLDLGDFSTLIVMLGTNDVYNHLVLVDQSISNIKEIQKEAIRRSLRFLICTIPPRNDWLDAASFYKTLDLNRRLHQLGGQYDVVEVYDAFMENNPPDGWKDLLEKRDDTLSSGAHPNPTGHSVIAGLLKSLYEQFLLQPPDQIQHGLLPVLNGLRVSWQPPKSKNIDHYVFEFGLEVGQYGQVLELTGLELDFVLLQRFFSPSPVSAPFTIVKRSGRAPQVVFQRSATIHYRIKTVNERGNQSAYSKTGSFRLGR